MERNREMPIVPLMRHRIRGGREMSRNAENGVMPLKPSVAGTDTDFFAIAVKGEHNP